MISPKKKKFMKRFIVCINYLFLSFDNMGSSCVMFDGHNATDKCYQHSFSTAGHFGAKIDQISREKKGQIPKIGAILAAVVTLKLLFVNLS